MRRFSFLALMLLPSPNAFVLPSDTLKRPKPLEVGTGKQLLFDEALIASKVGFTTTMNPATRADGPILVTDQPWEKARFSHGPSIVENHGVYQMWYTCM